MLPSEMTKLMALSASSGSDNKLLRSPGGVAGEYVGRLYDSLVRQGYLVEAGPSGYRFTEMGREAFLEFMQQNRTRMRHVVGSLQGLGIEIGPEMNKTDDHGSELEDRGGTVYSASDD